MTAPAKPNMGADLDLVMDAYGKVIELITLGELLEHLGDASVQANRQVDGQIVRWIGQQIMNLGSDTSTALSDSRPTVLPEGLPGPRSMSVQQAASGAGGDTRLLRLCVEFHRQHAAVAELLEDDEEALSAAMDARWQISDQIEGIVAGTPEEIHAKAAVALVLLHENCSTHSDGKSLDFAWAALRDVAGDKGVAS